MLNIGDYAHHRSTGNVGKVVAYGHQTVEGVYLPTLKVEVQVVNESGKKTRTFIEDVFQEWMQVEQGVHLGKPTETDLAIASC
ncbi:MAG: hypothetical protein RIE73_36420 [Coleofasciculus sp. C1-SOL-03]|jgi:hypothetical protein